MEYVATVTILAVLQTFWFAWKVGAARAKTGLAAPACSGAEEFERANRVHLNTVEQLVLVMPAMWVFAYYVHDLAAAAIGAVFIVGRFVYRSAYLRDPTSRSVGFMIGALAFAVLALGGLIGAGMRVFG